MRDWKINPKYLCRKHLLGNHVELHMAVGSINKNISLAGYTSTGLLEVHNMRRRHEELVKEILARGYNHQSELPDFQSYIAGNIDTDKSVSDLKLRCRECAVLLKSYNKHRETFK